MATVSAKVYEHHQKDDGTFNVKIVVYHNQQRKFIETPHYVSKRQLNSNFEVKDKFLLLKLNELLDSYREVISDLGPKIDFFSCGELRDYLESKDREIDIICFANDHIEQLKRQGREPYSRSFRAVKNSLIDYFKRSSASITEINSNMLHAYERYLRSEREMIRVNQLGKEVRTKEKGLSDSGVHNHMRDLRTLFNAARTVYNDEDLGIVKIKHYPFNKYKVGSAPLTRSRSNSLTEIKLIANLEVKEGSRAELAKDLYMLSFYMCGMNAVDIYNSNEKWINCGRVEYNRSKTKSRRKDKAFFSVKIVNEALPLLRKYVGHLSKRYTTYAGLDTALSEGMKQLRKKAGIDDLTIYWARHSFATIARNNCRMSLDDVSAALNHIDHGHKITDIYIAKDWKIVDDVQSAVIDLIKTFNNPNDSLSYLKEKSEQDIYGTKRRDSMRLVV
ncbi:recombinase [Mucilaginibacter sp. PAMC 26640]|nr:recombinase [Mucilaginibacter sp. PAMC 26640]